MRGHVVAFAYAVRTKPAMGDKVTVNGKSGWIAAIRENVGRVYLIKSFGTFKPFWTCEDDLHLCDVSTADMTNFAKWTINL
jgi:hypothetical protein